jgi:hypothetical protein
MQNDQIHEAHIEITEGQSSSCPNTSATSGIDGTAPASSFLFKHFNGGPLSARTQQPPAPHCIWIIYQTANLSISGG